MNDGQRWCPNGAWGSPDVAIVSSEFQGSIEIRDWFLTFCEGREREIEVVIDSDDYDPPLLLTFVTVGNIIQCPWNRANQ